MKIRVGMHVKFLNDTGGGVIKDFRDDRFAIVETEDGFDIPVQVKDLIPDESKDYAIEGSESPSPEKSRNESVEEESVTFEQKKYKEFQGKALLAIVPQNDKLLHVSNFDLYLINDSNYSLTYSVTLKDAAVSTLLQSGVIEPNTKISIAEFSQTEIGKITEFRLQGVYHKHGLTEILPPLDHRFIISDVSFYKTHFFNENDYFDQKALISEKEAEIDLREAIDQLKKGDISRVATIKEGKENKQVTKSPKQTQIEEIDLHIEEILDDHKGMSNSEILSAQLARFETALETASKSNAAKIVFIHGVGNGVLKLELRKLLDRKYSRFRYQDASFKEYGYGATMVYLR